MTSTFPCNIDIVKFQSRAEKALAKDIYQVQQQHFHSTFLSLRDLHKIHLDQVKVTILCNLERDDVFENQRGNFFVYEVEVS